MFYWGLRVHRGPSLCRLPGCRPRWLGLQRKGPELERERATLLRSSRPSLQARGWLSAPRAAPETSQRPTPGGSLPELSFPTVAPPPGGEGCLGSALLKTGTGAWQGPTAWPEGQRIGGPDRLEYRALASLSWAILVRNSP